MVTVLFTEYYENLIWETSWERGEGMTARFTLYQVTAKIRQEVGRQFVLTLLDSDNSDLHLQDDIT